MVEARHNDVIATIERFFSKGLLRSSRISSREIAGLTDKHHDHIRRDIRLMLTELMEDAPKFEGIYLDSMNRQQVEYHLGRELTDTLLTGYSIPLRRRVIARWHELEGKRATPVAAFAIPQTMAAALRLAADQAEEIERQQQALAAPKVAPLRIPRPRAALATARTLRQSPRRGDFLLPGAG